MGDEHRRKCPSVKIGGRRGAALNTLHAEQGGADAGPIAPVLLTAWTVAFLTSLAHFPCTVAGL